MQVIDRRGFLTFCSAVAGTLVLPNMFPENEVIHLTEPLVLGGLRNRTIDFNGCTFVLSDNYSPVGKRSAVIVKDCTNVTLKNLNIEGNKENNIENRTFGLIITKSQKVTVRDLRVSNISYHGVWVRAETPGTRFFNLILENNYGLQTSSDVYIDNLPTDDVKFIRTTATRDTNQGSQVFYIAGHNTTIDGLTSSDIHWAIVDYRRGKHTLKNVLADNCAKLFVVKGDADVTASDLVARGCVSDRTSSAIRIYSCARTAISNVLVEGQLYGLRIDPADAGHITNVTVTDFKSINARNAAIRMNNLVDSCVFKRIVCDPEASGYTLYLKGCTAPQPVDGLKEIEPNRGIYDPDNMLVLK